MFGSAVVYLGLGIIIAGLIAAARSVSRLRAPTPRRMLAVSGVGLATVGMGLFLPAPSTRISRVETRLDEFTPVWQFGEIHSLRVEAPPERVFEAIKRVRPDEIFLFRTLVRLRNAGRSVPADARVAAARFESLLDIATHSSFVYLADDPPQELVVGTLVGWPSGPRPPTTRELFQAPLPAGYALATMNFVVRPDGAAGSVVTTETRVHASSASARRRFAAYWRVIYPGSAFIRRAWLRAIQRRATTPVAG